MFSDIIYRIKKAILGRIYKLLIFELFVLEKNSVTYDKLKEFSRVEINTTHGKLLFIFKQDRRSKIRKNSDIFYRTFLVSIKAPEGANENLKELENYFILILKMNLIPINYRILTDVLIDICIEKYIQIAEILKVKKM